MDDTSSSPEPTAAALPAVPEKTLGANGRAGDRSSAVILLVDDSEDNRYAVRRHLERAGFQVCEATNGAETLRRAVNDPDLIILDVDLPDTNGFEVCRQLKADRNTAGIPVLHLSGTFTRTRDRVQGLDGGADGYLCHPVEPLELVATVNALLRIKRAEQALQEADRRKDEFLAMLAHELRNPLAPIRNAVEILRLVGTDDPHVRRATDAVDRQVTHMTRLIDDLLDVSRIARGKVVLRTEQCDLGRIVRESAGDHRDGMTAAGLTLTVEVPAAPLWVAGDCTRLAQVVGNLLHNAQKFTDPGGAVRVAVGTDGPVATVVVADTGIGIDADTLRRVFEPFAQADRSLARSKGGLGLGLSLVKGLAELHGGEVRAASAGPGAGSTFTVRLPLASAAAPPPPPPPPAVGPAALRILVIEDNPDTADTMRMLLGLLGHRVEVAATGPAGVKAARRDRPDVVLCDIGLPGGMDGFAVAQAIRDDPALAGTLLAAATGYGQEADQDRARAAGFDTHLTKPVGMAELRQVLAAGVTRRQPT